MPQIDPEWQLVHEDGQLFRLYNTSPQEAVDVTLTAAEIQLDGMGADYVRRVASVPADDYFGISLRPVWRGPDSPHLTLEWSRGGQRLTKIIKLF